MEQYEVGLSDAAKKDLESISSYILNELEAPQAAEEVLTDLENAVASLCFLPERVAQERREPREQVERAQREQVEPEP